MPPKSLVTDEDRVTRVKPEQTEIPGFEQEKIAEVERAADKYDEKRRIWQGLGEELIGAKELVVHLMHKHADQVDHDGEGNLAYARGDYKILVSKKETVKIRIAGDEESEN